MGLERVPCIRLDHLTDEQRRAYTLAHNKTQELAEYDFSTLEAELDALSADFDMESYGFVSIPGGVSEEETEAAAEDDYDIDAPVETIAKPGDIYRLGRHRLMCGDSTDADAVTKLLGGAKAALLLTDPPYGINVVVGGHIGTGNWPRGGGGGPLHFRNNRRSRAAALPAKWEAEA